MRTSVMLALLLGACAPTRAVDASPPPGAAAADRATAPAPASRAYTKPPEADLRARLTPLQFEVTQNEATEPAFHNEYWNNHQAGVYVDVATGEPLFSSLDKFESGTGWPSFTKPIEALRVVEHSDSTLGMERTEVVSRAGASHLGHVFDDGPPPTGRRYCINSAALRFVPVARLAAEGYGDYASRFGGGATAAAPPPPATSNACAVPPPGEKPGCSATLEIAILSSSPRDDRLARTTGILGVAPGYEGDQHATEVTFDPARLTYAELLAAWRKGGKADDEQATAFVQTDAQRNVARARQVRVVDAVPFRRE